MKPTIQSADEFRRSVGARSDPAPWWFDDGDPATERESMTCKKIRAALHFYGFCEPEDEVARVEKGFPTNPRGYFVFTSQLDARGSGSSAGVPDLFITLAGVPFVMAFEVKRPKGGRASPAQKLLIGSGAVRLVKSWREVMAVVNMASALFRGETLKAVQAAMGRK